MAISRAFGAADVTTRPPIKLSPLWTTSRPASMRSAVDLPDPEGPTYHQLAVFNAQVEVVDGG